MKKVFFILFISINYVNAQEIAGFAVDPGANNIAALFTMTNENGRIENLELMESVFKDKSLGFECERHHNVSSPYIYEKLTDLSSRLEKESTLLLYFNSHGGGSGDRFAMTAEGGSFKFSKALEAIKKSGKKVRRLILLVDTCHAAGSIQDSLKQDGELLKNIKYTEPTNYLPEISDNFLIKELPFTSFFVDYKRVGSFYITSSPKEKINFFDDEGIYEEILIISSCSVEDLATRGVFANRLAKTFSEIRSDKMVTVEGFLKKFAESHSKSGQQPYYKILPNKKMLRELLFGPYPAQKVPIKNHGKKQDFDIDYILIPSS